MSTMPLRARAARIVGRSRVRGSDRVARRLFPPRAGFTGVVAAADGTRYHVDSASYLEWYVLVHGAYEGRLARLMRSSLSRGDAVLDCGANVGIHTCSLARAVGATGRVVAVEPLDELAARLDANVELNGLRNVDVVRAAVGAAAGSARLFAAAPDAANRGEASLHRRAGSTRAREVEVTTVDALAESHALDRLRLVKIDVEGHEPAVLQGASQTLAARRPVVVFEYDPESWAEAGSAWADVAPFWRDLSYHLQWLTERQPPTAVPAGGPDAQCMVVATP